MAPEDDGADAMALRSYDRGMTQQYAAASP